VGLQVLREPALVIDEEGGVHVGVAATRGVKDTFIELYMLAVIGGRVAACPDATSFIDRNTPEYRRNRHDVIEW
jgi:hypothetical protein